MTMKDETIKITREEWNYLRSYTRVPICKEYEEKVRICEIIEKNRYKYEIND